VSFLSLSVCFTSWLRSVCQRPGCHVRPAIGSRALVARVLGVERASRGKRVGVHSGVSPVSLSGESERRGVRVSVCCFHFCCFHCMP
jgi:hypothetical protein